MVEVLASQVFEGGQRIDKVKRGDGHQYRVYNDHTLADGTVIPNVTSVLSAAIAKPFLVPWNSKLWRESLDMALSVQLLKETAGDKRPLPFMVDDIRTLTVEFHKKASTSARDWGSGVHEAMETFLGGGDLTGMPEFLRMVGNGLRAYLALKGVANLAQEVILYDPNLGVAGTADLIGTLDGHHYIADYKATGSFYAEQGYQLSAYSQMFLSNPPIHLARSDYRITGEVIRLPQEPENMAELPTSGFEWVNPREVDIPEAFLGFKRALAMFKASKDFNVWADKKSEKKEGDDDATE